MNEQLRDTLTFLFVVVPIVVFVVYIGLSIYFRINMRTVGERPGARLLRGLYNYFSISILSQLFNVVLGLLILLTEPLRISREAGAILFVALFLGAQVFRAIASTVFAWNIFRVRHQEVAVITIDINSFIVYANPAAYTMFGYSPGELDGRSLTDLQPEKYRSAHLYAIQRYAQTNKRGRDWDAIHGEGLTKDGVSFPVVITLTESVDKESNQKLIVGVIRREDEARE